MNNHIVTSPIVPVICLGTHRATMYAIGAADCLMTVLFPAEKEHVQATHSAKRCQVQTRLFLHVHPQHKHAPVALRV